MMKFAGSDWRDGTAMYYVVHMEDHFGKLFHPDLLFGYMGALQFLTYKTLVLETLAPLLLWFDRTRNATLVSLFLFHLGIDLSMNLEMFHWIMIVGWLSFLAQPFVWEDNSKEEPTKATTTTNKPMDEKKVDEGAKGKEGGTEILETKEKKNKTKKKGKQRK
jgi:hypothetical protein